MKNKKTFLILVLAFVLLLGGAYTLYDRLAQEVDAGQMIVHAQAEPQTTASPDESAESGETGEAAETGESAEAEAPDESNEAAESAEAAEAEEPEAIPAPDFTVMDKDGNEVKLSQYFGKPIVLNFWASWCGPCQSEMPDFNEKYLELGDDVHFVMVNMTDGGRETVEKATAFIEGNGYAFPILFDTRAQAAMTYGAYSLPTSFFINAQGHVIAQAVGAINAATLQKGIDMITE